MTDTTDFLLYDESQRWTGAALAIMVTVLVPSAIWLVVWPELDAPALTWLVLGLLVVLPVALLVTRLRVRVGMGWLRATMFPLPYRRRVGIDEVESVELVDVRPIRDYGGYGARRAPGRGTALLMGGTRAVRLTLRGGKLLTIGTPDPEALAQAIVLAGGPQPAA